MTHITLDTSDNVPRRAFHEKVERIKELEAENERLYSEWKLAADTVDGLMTALSGAHEIIKRGLEVSFRLDAENARLTAALVECQEAFDSGVEQ